MQKFTAVIQFLRDDIWRIPAHNLSASRSFFLRQLRVVLLAFRGFDEDNLQLRASALTFFTLLAIVPVAAMAFGVAKGFGLEAILREWLLNEFAGHEEIIGRIIHFADNLLAKTRGSMMAGIGVAVLYWAVIKVLGHIERSFNHIWGIEKARTWWRKFSDYLTIMLICPLLVVLSSSFTVFLETQLTTIVNRIALLGFFSPLLFVFFKLLPYTLIWILFTFTYLLMPNTRVRFKSALLAGIVAGTIYQVGQIAYLNFQFIISRYNAIYGSFAALPLFLVWLQISWMIVLFGAEISFAHQNIESYEFEPDSRRISQRMRQRLALQILHLLVKKFQNGEPPPDAADISATLEIPNRLVNRIIQDLVEAGMLSEIRLADDDRDTAYQPALDIDRLTIAFVLQRLAGIGSEDPTIPETTVAAEVKNTLAAFEECIQQSPRNKRLADLPAPAAESL